ncbi:MAG: HD domain-containing protein [Armatimonadetes bacterium]|nr:HD domain-containing protein [Armatimonadota bacterium]MDW8121412.1 HD domain-containing phosphohydrolase [Armatimonadota bacterium]
MSGWNPDWMPQPDKKFLLPLSALLDRDPFAIEHGIIAGRCAAATAKALTLEEATWHQLACAGLLHDAGKIAIEPRILRKPGKLTEEEWEVVKQHPIVGRTVARALKLNDWVVEGIQDHHERWDGQGYPGGKMKDEISLQGQILAVSELVSAVLTPRWYRPGMAPAQLLTESRRWIGTHVNPEVLRACLSALPALFGLSALSELETFRSPLDSRHFSGDLEAQVYRAANAFISQVFWEAGRLFGQTVCERTVDGLNQWAVATKLPIFFSGLKMEVTYPWWESLSHQVLNFRNIIGAIVSCLSGLVGEPLACAWMDSILMKLPENLRDVGTDFGLWIWKPVEIVPLAGVR